jgi:predicted metal-dependent hydrolase
MGAKPRRAGQEVVAKVAQRSGPETLAVDELRFTVRRSDRRRTLEIGVDRQGQLTLAVPSGCSDAEVERYARARKFWVYTKLAKKDLLYRPVPAKEFVEGEGFLYLGRSYRLKVVDDQAEPFKLQNGRLCLRRQDTSDARKHLLRWYSSRAATLLAERVRMQQSAVGVDPSGVRVQDLGYRWGSCGKGQRLFFHWKTMLLPMRIIDYVVAHELVHLCEPHHTPEFWRLLERAMPDYARRKDWLAVHGNETEGY